MEAFNKFDQWLLKKSDITVHTDHQPLQSIFQKDLAVAPKCGSKRWCSTYNIVYKRGTSLHLTDKLSRAPSQGHDKHTHEIDTFQLVFRLHITQQDPTLPGLTDTTRDQLHQATASCPDMQLLEHHIIHGWPPTKEHLPIQLQPFWNYRDELSVANSLLIKSTRAIAPTSLQPNMLNKIHQSYRGHE